MDTKKLSVILKALEGTSVREIFLETKKRKLLMVKARTEVKPLKEKKTSQRMPISVQNPIGEVSPEEKSGSGKYIVSRNVGYFSRFDPRSNRQMVKLRDVIKKGSTVAIIRSAHIEHEVIAEQEGKIVEFLVEEGQPIEYGQPLMRLERRKSVKMTESPSE